MVNKKGYMKILEAVIAIVILLLFITVLAIQNRESEPKTPQDISLLQDTTVNGIKNDDSLRTCALNGDKFCIENYIDGIIPSGYGYELYLCTDLDACPEVSGLPDDKSVYAETFLIASSDEVKSLVGFYLWREL